MEVPVKRWFFWVTGLLVALGIGCSGDDECQVGGQCERACPEGQTGLCVAKNLCECSALTDAGIPGVGGMGGGTGGMGGSPPECAAAEPGDIVINEVMIDGIREASDEYVELVNTTDEARLLRGLTVKYRNDGDEKSPISFLGGCLPAKSAVAVYPDVKDIVWSTQPNGFDVELKGFGFANSKPFTMRLVNVNGVEINVASGGTETFKENVSANRSPDLVGANFVLHNTLGADNSPARCANGERFEDGCPEILSDMGPDAGADMGPEAGTDMGPVLCRAAQAEEIIINEVMINADPGVVEEFFELVNITNQPLSLDGVLVRSNFGDDGLRDRVIFTGGCMPKQSAVALFSERAVWSTDPKHPPEVDIQGFNFANGRDFRFEVRRGDLLINVAVGTTDVFGRGISATRATDGDRNSDFVLHNSVGGSNFSPAQCANGARFEDFCDE